MGLFSGEGSNPNIFAKAKERFAPVAVSTETQSRAAELGKKVNEGGPLIDMARQGWTEERTAAANADSADEAARTAREQGLDVQKAIAERRKLEQDAEKKRRQKINAALRGKLGKPTPEDRALIQGDLGLPAEAAPTDADLEKFTLTALDEDAKAEKSRADVIDARGELPGMSLENDANLANEASEASERMMQSGLRIIESLEKQPDGANNLDNLREANLANGTFARAEKTRASRLDTLAGRLKDRYPDRADAIDGSRTAVDTELTNKRNEIAAPNVEISDTDKDAGAEKESDKIDTVVTREANRKALALELGIEVDDQGKEHLTEGGLLDRQMSAEANVAALDKAYQEALAKAKEDPRLADRALTMALLRRQAMSSRDSINSEITGVNALAKAEEAAQIAEEAAQLEADIDAQKRAAEWARGVADAKKVANKGWSLPGRALGAASRGIFGAIEKVASKLKGASESYRQNCENAMLGSNQKVEEEATTQESETAKKIAELERQLRQLRGEPEPTPEA